MTETLSITGTAAASAAVLCHLDDLTVGRGVAALVGDEQIALFRLPGDEIRALDNRDPFTGANVLSRGLLGTDADGGWYVASPLHKQRFSLDDGRCLDDDAVSVTTHAVVVTDGVIRRVGS